jgi:hypothetical protein
MPASPLATQPIRTLNDNGAWCWFQGERAIVTRDGDLLVGSTPSAGGTSGATRSGAVEVTSADVTTLSAPRVDQLARPGRYRSDDHVSPGLIELPDGRVVAAWAGHNDDRYKHSATLDRSDLAWSGNAGSARGMSTTYANLLALPAENGGKGRLYDFYRAEQQGVNAMVSDDGGRSWRYGGLLVKNAPLHPYTRFVVNGSDRIDFVSTSGNPQSIRGSTVRAGFLRGNRIHTSDGRPIGTLGAGVDWQQLTLVAAGTVAPTEGPDADVWTSDLAVAGGRPVALLTVKRQGSPSVPGRRYHQEYLVARWDGAAWATSRVAWGGSELYDTQPSYAGNLVFDQRNPSRVLLSSNVDPRTGGRLDSAADGRPHWEIYEATSTDAGSSWSLAAVTANSSVDHLRPVHASGHGRAAVVWLRGTYTTFRDYDLEVVGVPDAPGAAAPKPMRSRLARTTAVAPGRWDGGGSDGLFVVAEHLDGSGFVLAGERGSARRFVNVPLQRRDRPVAYNVDGDGREEVLLVDPTGGGSHRVVAYRPGGEVATTALPGPRGATPIVGDFDGRGGDDILWYVPGAAADRLDLAGGPQRTVSVTGSYRPVAGDFDGDGIDDVAWHAPGTARDHLWFGSSSGRFTSVPIAVSGSYSPVATDADGDGRDDIVWQAGSLQRPSYLWTSRGRTFRSARWHQVATPATSGDFDGDGRDDLLFDRAGDLPDTWWWS